MSTNYDSSFYSSDDFINISEPPKAKETPNVSLFNSSDTSYASQSSINLSQNIPRNPPKLHRKRTTNYWDSLRGISKEDWENENNNIDNFRFNESNTKNIGPPPLLSSSYYNSTLNYLPQRSTQVIRSQMNAQDNKHDMQTLNLTDDTTLGDNDICGVDRGVHAKFNSRSNNDKLNILGTKSVDLVAEQENELDTRNNSHNENTNKSVLENHQIKPPINGRRSSFEYEDFKKDIYQKLKFFDK